MGFDLLRYRFGNVTFFTPVPLLEQDRAKVIAILFMPKRDAGFSNLQSKSQNSLTGFEIQKKQIIAPFH